VAIANLPGPSRIILDLNYKDIHAEELVRAYPWDPKYRIFSAATGKLAGWFEGKFERFDFSGHADLASVASKPAPGIVALPLDGSLDYVMRPNEEQLRNADLRLHSTTVRADGVIRDAQADLKVNLSSSNLKDLAFVYADANGVGSFNGSLTGRIEKPV